MNANIKVPKMVAEALDIFVELADSKSQAFTDILSLGYETIGSETILRHFDGNNDELMSALINGYTGEETNEEKLTSYYNYLYFSTRDEYTQGTIDGILETLKLLGINIRGVSA
jgi:predicted secreted protein